MNVQALGSLVGNGAVQLEPYLHQIMPFILTCMVGKRLGVRSRARHHVLPANSCHRRNLCHLLRVLAHSDLIE